MPEDSSGFLKQLGHLKTLYTPNRSYIRKCTTNNSSIRPFLHQKAFTPNKSYTGKLLDNTFALNNLSIKQLLQALLQLVRRNLEEILEGSSGSQEGAFAVKFWKEVWAGSLTQWVPMWAIVSKIQEAGKWPIEDPAAVTWKSCLVSPWLDHWQLKLQVLTEPLFGIEYLSGEHLGRPQDMNQRHECSMFGHLPLWSFCDYIHHITSFCKFCLFGTPACTCLSSSTCHIDCNTSVSSRQIKKSYARPSSSWCLPSSVCREPATNIIAASQRIISKK